MMFYEQRVLDPPDRPWLRRLRPDHWIWLSKDRIFARVATLWQPPESGYGTGRLTIDTYRDNCCRTEMWYVDERGLGLDHSLIVQPVEGNLVTQVNVPVGEFEELKAKVEDLERYVTALRVKLDIWSAER